MDVKMQNEKKIYSDGLEVEEQMLRVAEEYPEDLSQDFIADNSKYTINNTFSSVRRNILNWYSFKPDADILEVGAGMGSLTGLLCDVAKSVTSIEMSEARARVIRARYPQRTNLNIISENINDWDTDQRFDYIVFIGVLEYAAIFSDAERPYEEFLSSCKKLLKPDGTLLFAIENRFGLKYWAGGAEDHLQKPFVGVEGYKEKKTARTFSQVELEKLMDNVGLMNHRFYNIFPDYKFPTLICTDEYRPSYMNLQKVAFTYSKNSLFAFNEKDIYKDIIENNTLGFFANSYLIEAKIEPLEEDHVIYVSARGESQKEYRISTTISSSGVIKKIPVHPQAEKHIETIERNEQNLRDRGIRVIDTTRSGSELICTRFTGIEAQDYFEDLLEQNDWEGIKKLILKLQEDILKSSDVSTEPYTMIDDAGLREEIHTYEGPVLRDGYIDMTFYNAFYQDEELIFYDQEWNFKNAPLNFILYYAIKSAYQRIKVDTQISLSKILGELKLDINSSIYEKLEEYVWSKVLYRQTDFYGEDGYCNRFDEEKLIVNQIEHLNEEQEKLNQIIKLQCEEIADGKRVITKAHDEIHSLIVELKKEETLEKQIEILRAELNNKKGHIAQLIESERNLSGEIQLIKATKMYKMNTIVWKAAGKLLPMNSKRRFLLSLTLRSLRHPIRTMRKFSFSRVRNMFRDLNERDIESVSQHFNECVGASSLDDKIEVTPLDEITTIEDCEKLVFDYQENPLVTIIIPVYNQFTYTYYCLNSIRKNSKDVSYEIIIADDCSNDLTTRITEIAENISVIRTNENLRFLKNCNNAAQYAKGKYILFLNNDTQVQENWLLPLVELCEKDHSIGMTGSKLVYANGKLQEAGGIMWKDGTAWNYGNRQDPSRAEYNYVKDVDYISGASLMIRRELWEEIGGFDPLFAPAYCEDSDLAFSVRKHGYRVVYQPMSVVVHFEGISNGTDVTKGVKQYQVENLKKLKKKWSAEFEELFDNGKNVFRARERSKNKGIVVVIDHYVPHFDQDAGSRTILQYLKMFIEQGLVVKFIGDNFYQHEPYTTVLQQMGVEVLYGSYYADHIFDWINNNKNDIDVIFLNRPHISIKYIDFIKEKTNIRTVYYGSDLHYVRVNREYELTKDKKKIKEASDWKEKEYYLMERMNVSYYPSKEEIEEIHSVNPKISAKAIPVYAYDTFLPDINREFTSRNDILFVGGFRHEPNLDAVVWFVEQVWPQIYKELNIKFNIVGSNPPNYIKELDGVNGVVVKGFVSDEELDKLYQDCRMVVVPLRYGAGVKGKVIEAIYNGLPIVTTPIGAEGIEDSDEILVVENDPAKFADAVVELYQDCDRMKAMSEKTQEYIKKYFSTDAVWNIVGEDFTK